jgi:hypothetical protein
MNARNDRADTVVEDPTMEAGMKWWMQFYNARRGILARYDVDAPLPAEAVQLGWKAVLAEHPSTPRRGRLSLFEQAERIGGQDASGWVLYRIAKHEERESQDVAPAHAA